MTTPTAIKFSIRRGLLATMIGLLVVLLTIQNGFQIHYHKQSLENEIDKRVQIMKDNLLLIGNTQADNLTQQVKSNIAEYNFSNLSEQLDNAVKSNRELSYAMVTDSSRVVYIHTTDPSLKKETLIGEEDLKAARQTAPATHDFKRNGIDYIEFIRPIYFATALWGHLRLGFSYEHLDREISKSRQEVRQQIRTMVIRSTLTLLIFLAVGIVIVLFVATKLSDPLVELTGIANRIAEGDFKAVDRIRIRSRNEVGLLAKAFIAMSESLKDYSRNLEQKVRDRTEELSLALDNLKAAQHQLVESEKMAALGSLVAGVAHEINTPIGVGVTAASTFQEDLESFEKKYHLNDLSRADLERVIESGKTSNKLILTNLERASELVQGFKQVAIDQTSEDKRKFALRKCIEDTINSLNPKLKRTKLSVNLTCDNGLVLDSYPGFFSQIIANLILNSILHGYDDDDEGTIAISAIKRDGTLTIIYSDDGKGMDDDVRSKIYQPFFTTKKGSGGSGLGLHIIYNLICQNLGGTIDCQSKPGEGATFTITIPLSAE